MKKIFFLLLISFWEIAHAQQFINSGMIEFEVRVNNLKAFGDGFWAQMLKDKMPPFSTSWYDFTFNNNKAIYKFDRLDEKTKLPWQDRWNEEDNIWYSDYTAGTFCDQKNIFGDIYLLQDSLMNMKWKIIPNETREIAGFTCRKAQAVIFDSVYVFAFYTDEITISGGPMGIHGLPGMILGITIPRMFTSWIATSLQLNRTDLNSIAEPKKGKKKKAKELEGEVKKATSDWGSWGQKEIWDLFL